MISSSSLRISSDECPCEACTMQDLEPPKFLVDRVQASVDEMRLRGLTFDDRRGDGPDRRTTARMGLVGIEERRSVAPSPPEVLEVVRASAVPGLLICPDRTMPLDAVRLGRIVRTSKERLSAATVVDRLLRGLTVRTVAYVYRMALPVRAVSS